MPHETRSEGYSRRKFLTGTGALAGASVAGCMGGGGGGSDSVKLGFVLPFSGTYSFLGESIVNGVKLRLDQQLDGEIDGRTVEYVRQDTGADPSTGASITQEFLQSENVDFIVGPVSSAVAGAMKPEIAGTGSAIWLNANAGNYKLVQDNCTKYHFRTSFNTWQTSAPLASFVKNNVSDNVVLSYANYTFGQQSKNLFREEFESIGGTVVSEIGAPLGTSDYSSFLQEIENSGADAVFSFFAGSDAVNYIKQFSSFGLNETMTQTGSGFLLSADTLQAQGKAALGMYSLLHYTPTKQSDRNQEFVDAYSGQFDATPNVYACQGYDSGLAAEMAVKEAGGTDADTMVDSLSGKELDSPRGYFKFRSSTHDPIMDMDIRQVVEANEGVRNEVVETLSKVEGPTWGCSL
ncbi:ABC transporter substrate-binding protein [Halomicroarcula limicola]|uniref:ABC transporter substrate-binding protein n=2 Tax=Haloarcula limicola TaxID=1429915 RepID=A0A8J7Y7E3_9EURY|nr:ABC transporter substrate-binding protein [Halomicroarcula limicola]